ncbi:MULTISPECIES: hypothetical protein [Corynebacterium]|uniref:hypothetical protein n=1 Tax=Corynebacterium TaxID=1716 RepID=UPI000668A82C|nr:MULTISPECIES: hypothetical protein [Corynebacterium]ASE56874.1 hypothetical protein CEQ06_07820 [Corynebacterium jeikeium]KAA9225258.1 hypothetical protein F6I44_01030 [Corynebacterium amycolatum]KAA9226750.1 hypothetical protein F6I42_04380 [Corynebacterium amycolatum]KAA9246747.1 hypothetical protein F6I30_02015 [Corynebacterium amycolatum]MBC6767602.1 hypothetical protein [Corynebacterium sp. LK15]
MFRRTSVLATTIASAALSLSALTGAPAATAAPTATTSSDDLQVKEYALSDTFSCDYYNLPWCR